MSEYVFPPNALRVIMNTSRRLNTQIHKHTEENLLRYANSSPEVISARISELEREWDTEKTLEANGAAIVLISIALGLLISHWWFLLTGLVAFYLLLHAIQGWCPPLPLLRKFGIRTMTEINAEKTALKLIRGDFDDLRSDPVKALKAADA